MNPGDVRPIGTRFTRTHLQWQITYEVINHLPRFDGGGLIEIVREVEREKISKPKPSETKDAS